MATGVSGGELLVFDKFGSLKAIISRESKFLS